MTLTPVISNVIGFLPFLFLYPSLTITYEYHLLNTLYTLQQYLKVGQGLLL